MSEWSESASVVIVGGGVAGLAAAWQLAERGMRGVVLIEADEMLASHSSARNAAIHMVLEENLGAVRLAARSRAMLDALMGTSWIEANGMVYFTSEPDGLDELRFWARQSGAFHQTWQDTKLRAQAPLLDTGHEYHALSLPLGGVMDVHRVTTFLAERARKCGARLFKSSRLAKLEIENDAVAGCVLESGRRIHASQVVLAAGAWAGQLGEQLGYPLPFTPLKRHLAQLTGPRLGECRQMPVLWRLDDQVYLRPESGGILASPCDETPWHPELPQSDPDAIELLGGKLSRLSTRFDDAGVQRSWACLRTIAPDRELVVGPDPRLKGLYWSAGYGGRGMTAGPAAGELLALSVLGLPHPALKPLQPRRLLD